jgi:hypothetical protein
MASRSRAGAGQLFYHNLVTVTASRVDMAVTIEHHALGNTAFAKLVGVTIFYESAILTQCCVSTLHAGELSSSPDSAATA